MPDFVTQAAPDDDLSDLLEFSDIAFDDCTVQRCIIKSPRSKAPGLSGLTADVLHLIADHITLLILV